MVCVVIGLCLINERWTTVAEANTLFILIVSRETCITNNSTHSFSDFLYTLCLHKKAVFRYHLAVFDTAGTNVIALQAPPIHLLYRTRCFQQNSQYESGCDLACLLRMPNMVAIVAKIDIQILHLLSQLQCLFFTELLCGRKSG